MAERPVIAAGTLPALIAAGDERARTRFVEFFASNIRNPHTRRAYARTIGEFLDWCRKRSVSTLDEVRPLHVAAWIERQTRRYSPPTVKQQLAAIRHLFDWLVTGQVVPVNPASSVRGPKHSVKKGKTPVLEPAEARKLLDSIETDTHAGLRDRALIGLMVYTFARIGAALAMKVEDVYSERRRALGPPPRERRQAPRDALPPQSGAVSTRLHRRDQDRRRSQAAALSHHRAQDEAAPDLGKRVEGRYQLTTDGLEAYIPAVREHLGNLLDFAQLIKQYSTRLQDSPDWYKAARFVRTIPSPISGDPDQDRISTSHVERVNLSVRTFLRRFTRLALGFSKSLRHLQAAVAVWVMWYNFCRIHGSLRVTPAMESGLTDHVWTVAEMISATQN